MVCSKKSSEEQISAVRGGLSEEAASDSRYCYFGKTDEAEMAAFIGLMYLRGLLSLNTHATEVLFGDKTGYPVFSATMSKNRFKFLSSNIMFAYFGSLGN